MAHGHSSLLSPPPALVFSARQRIALSCSLGKERSLHCDIGDPESCAIVNLRKFPVDCAKSPRRVDSPLLAHPGQLPYNCTTLLCLPAVSQVGPTISMPAHYDSSKLSAAS